MSTPIRKGQRWARDRSDGPASSSTTIRVIEAPNENHPNGVLVESLLKPEAPPLPGRWGRRRLMLIKTLMRSYEFVSEP